MREVEKRVEGMRKGKGDAEDAAKGKNTPWRRWTGPRMACPKILRDHARLMCDIIAIAFQTNKTRVASLIISRDLSAMYYPFLDVKDGHHAASHNNNSDGYERIARFHVSQYAYLASKLDSMKEGDGTVLDNTCLMFLSNMWIGRKHDNFRLPLILAGGLGGTLETGRTLNYLNESEDNRKMCSLYLSLMDRFGIKLEQFGDAQTSACKPLITNVPACQLFLYRLHSSRRSDHLPAQVPQGAPVRRLARLAQCLRPVIRKTPGYVTAKELPDGSKRSRQCRRQLHSGADTQSGAGDEPAAKASRRERSLSSTCCPSDSKLYPGIAREPNTYGTADPDDPAKMVVTTSHPGSLHSPSRVYVPKQYVPGTRGTLHCGSRRTRSRLVHSAG